MHRYFLKIMYFFVSIVFILLTYCTKATEVDNKPPEVVITYPKNGAVISEPIFITAQVTDNVEVKKVDFYVDSLLINSDVIPSYEAYFNPYYHSDGADHIITVIAEDINGNISLPEEVEISIPLDLENFPELISPENNEFICNDTLVTFKWFSFADASSYNLIVALDSDFTEIIYDLSLEDTISVYKPPQKDRYYWKIKAYDQLGNSSNWSIVNSFFYDEIITFNRIYNKIEGNKLTDCIQLENGDFIAFGTFPSDYWQRKTIIIKTDKYGNLLWNRTYESEPWYARGNIVQTEDGGFALAGYANYDTLTHHEDMALIRLDSNGNVLWYQDYPLEYESMGKKIINTQDGGFVLLGDKKEPNLRYDARVIKTDNQGSIEWEHYSNHIIQRGGDIIQNDAGEYIFTTRAQYGLYTDTFVYIAKLDDSGNRIWRNSIGTYGYDNHASYVEESLQGYMITGHDSQNIILVEINEDGEVIWGDEFNFTYYNIITDFELLTDGNYLITGIFDEGLFENHKLLLLKVNGNGSIIWKKTYQFNNEMSFALSGIECYDKGFIISGGVVIKTSGNMWLFKADKDGYIKPKFK